MRSHRRERRLRQRRVAIGAGVTTIILLVLLLGARHFFGPAALDTFDHGAAPDLSASALQETDTVALSNVAGLRSNRRHKATDSDNEPTNRTRRLTGPTDEDQGNRAGRTAGNLVTSGLDRQYSTLSGGGSSSGSEAAGSSRGSGISGAGAGGGSGGASQSASVNRPSSGVPDTNVGQSDPDSSSNGISRDRLGDEGTGGPDGFSGKDPGGDEATSPLVPPNDNSTPPDDGSRDDSGDPVGDPNPGPGPVPVPEPATLLFLGAGLVLTGRTLKSLKRRRNPQDPK